VTPHDIVGQMGILSRALRSIGVDAWSVEVERRSGHLQFEIDERLDVDPTAPRITRLARRGAFAGRAIRSYDVLHYFFGRSLLPGRVDVVAARAARRAVFVHFRGRDITTVAGVVAGSLAVGGPGVGARGTSAQSHLARSWTRWANVLVSTPDLWREAPDATLLPQAIELDRWPYEPLAPGDGDSVIIGHAPTNQPLKGTHHVEAAVTELRHQGLDVVLDLIEGVSPTEAAARLRRCHVVVDQVVQGAYGNVSIQAMALGRPTLNHLDAMYAERDIQVPTVATAPATLADDLRSLLADRARLDDLGRRGRAYVEAVHDSGVIAALAHDLYTAALPRSRRRAQASRARSVSGDGDPSGRGP
jgi:hypothetical protein